MESTLSISSRSLQYYVITMRWLADLEFYKFEIAFLHKLLERNIMHTKDYARQKELLQSDNKLREIKAMVNGDLLAGQINQLELMAEDIIPEDAESLAETQVKLEYFMTEVVKKFREVKKDIFGLVIDTTQISAMVGN